MLFNYYCIFLLTTLDFWEYTLLFKSLNVDTAICMYACFFLHLFSTISMVTARHRFGFDKIVRTGLPIEGVFEGKFHKSWLFVRYLNYFTNIDIDWLLLLVGFLYYRCLWSDRPARLSLLLVWVPSRYGSVVSLARAKRFDGWNSSKADVGWKNRKSEWNCRDFMDWWYVHNARWKSYSTGQNNDPHPPICKPSLQPTWTSLPSVEPWTGGERRPSLCNQDRLWSWIHWRKPYVSLALFGRYFSYTSSFKAFHIFIKFPFNYKHKNSNNVLIILFNHNSEHYKFDKTTIDIVGNNKLNLNLYS